MRTYLSVLEVQQIMLSLFDDVLDFLNSHQLTYTLTGGSALGAVRHQGFIPWDDDMDIALPRDDYEFFIRNYRPKQTTIELRELALDSTWFYGYARVVDTTTAADNLWAKTNNGVFLDIFPIDHLSDNKRSRQLSYWRMKVLDVLRNSTRRLDFQPWEKGIWLKKTLYLMTKYTTTAKLATRMSRLAIKTNDKYKSSKWGSLYLVQGINGQRETNPFDWYVNTIEVEFEHRKVKVPREYHAYLQHLYGDTYMELPPIESRKSHGMYYNI